jgi:hypothetical protein
MVLRDPGDSLCIFRVLLGNNGQIADLGGIVRNQVLEGALVILGDLIRDETRHDWEWEVRQIGEEVAEG